MQLVNVLKQVGRNVLPEWIQDDPRSFAPGHSGGRYEVTITDDQHNCIGLLFQSQCGNVHADTHIDGFLLKPRNEIVISQVIYTTPTIEQVLLRLLFDNPLPVAANFAQSQGKVRTAAQSFKQARPESCLVGLSIVNCMLADWQMAEFSVGPSVVEKATEEQGVTIRCLNGPVYMPKMSVNQTSNGSVDFIRIGQDTPIIKTRQPSEKKAAVN